MKTISTRCGNFAALFIALLIFTAESSHARTRDAVLAEAAIYQNLPWTPSSLNILDVKDHVHNLTQEDESKIGGTDGIDDRAFEWDDTLETPKWVYATTHWPFTRDVPVTGEAYAWGGSKGSDLWGAETTADFSARVNGSGWIAGAEAGDILPSVYDGFAGVDCSGFVGNSLDINRFAVDHYKFNVAQVKERTASIKLEEIRPGNELGLV